MANGLPACFYQIHNPKKREFIVGYAMTGSFMLAAKRAGCERTIHYHWMDTDPVYKEVWAYAKEMAADVMQDELTRRAMGWEEEHFTDHGTPYNVYKYSDLLLIFRMKAMRPKEYRENTHLEVESTNTVNVTIEDRTRHANARLEELRRAHQSIPDPLG